MYLCPSNSAIALDPEDLHRLATTGLIEPLFPAKQEPARRKWTRLTATQKDEVVTAYTMGEASTSLTSRFCVPKSVVLSVLHGAGVQTRRQSMIAADICQACEFYEASNSLSHVAATLSLKKGNVRLV